MTELIHDCPKSGFACPDCNEQEKLTYRIKPDEYVCGACGLVSTVNEVVAHSKELWGEHIENRIKHNLTPTGGSSPDPATRRLED